MVERMHELRLCMESNCELLMKAMAGQLEVEVDDVDRFITRLVDEYKEYKLELSALELEFRKEYLIR